MWPAEQNVAKSCNWKTELTENIIATLDLSPEWIPKWSVILVSLKCYLHHYNFLWWKNWFMSRFSSAGHKLYPIWPLANRLLSACSPGLSKSFWVSEDHPEHTSAMYTFTCQLPLAAAPLNTHYYVQGHMATLSDNIHTICTNLPTNVEVSLCCLCARLTHIIWK